MQNNLRLILVLLLGLCAQSSSYADILYLNNGEALEGFVAREEKNSIEFDLGYGVVTFGRSEIKRIYKSGAEESAAIRKRWEKEKLNAQENATQALTVRSKLKRQWEKEQARIDEEARLEELLKPKEVSFSSDSGQVIISALLNNVAQASLVLDTGSSLVLLAKKTAEKAQIDLNQGATVELKLADGRLVKAKQASIKNIKIGDSQAQDVACAVFLEDVEDEHFGDGLLGMSFLSRFNVTLDRKNNKLILKPLEGKDEN
ncbi:MAG: retropepsin-like aspartic protease [Candidatus Omnitrophica bacterium]|nr:retropepsin-like aspartic protease [Candidatus Omnitrophota bacterium]MDD5653701.1 retropepsin-like aspartic protease [Candidatus Omnitrophota bacterium]